MPPKPAATGSADQDPAEGVFTGVPCITDSLFLFGLAPLHLQLNHIEHLHGNNRRVAVLCIVHGSFFTIVPVPFLGEHIRLVGLSEVRIPGMDVRVSSGITSPCFLT